MPWVSLGNWSSLLQSSLSCHSTEVIDLLSSIICLFHLYFHDTAYCVIISLYITNSLSAFNVIWLYLRLIYHSSLSPAFHTTVISSVSEFAGTKSLWSRDVKSVGITVISWGWASSGSSLSFIFMPPAKPLGELAVVALKAVRILVNWLTRLFVK